VAGADSEPGLRRATVKHGSGELTRAARDSYVKLRTSDFHAGKPKQPRAWGSGLGRLGQCRTIGRRCRGGSQLICWASILDTIEFAAPRIHGHQGEHREVPAAARASCGSNGPLCFEDDECLAGSTIALGS